MIMKLEFDPSLIEEVIFGELKAREEKGDFSLTLEYHSCIDPVYENFPLEERPSQFKKIEWDFFKKLGFPTIIKKIVVKFLPDRFQKISYLRKLARHELMHASDMLSESYGYRDERLGGNPMEERIVKEQYCTFWDIYVDSRLIRKGKETLSDKEGRYSEFESLYKKIPDEVKIAIFDVLWQDENLTHDKILGLAKDVNEVIKISDGLPIKHTLKKKKTILPGAQCPLCQFRTYYWMENIEQDSYLVNAIKKDFPDWEPEDGVCGQCIEAYKVRITVC